MFSPCPRWFLPSQEERPCTHYELLGISPNEPDPAVIEEAAVARTAQVRAYQITQPQECTRLLNDIAWSEHQPSGRDAIGKAAAGVEGVGARRETEAGTAGAGVDDAGADGEMVVSNRTERREGAALVQHR